MVSFVRPGYGPGYQHELTVLIHCHWVLAFDRVCIWCRVLLVWRSAVLSTLEGRKAFHPARDGGR